MFAYAKERLAVLRRMGYPPWDHHLIDGEKLNDVVTEVVRWNAERQQPKLRHHALRVYRRLVLPYKDWRLPWR